MNRFRQMAVFAHIVESGSITGAADSLELSKSVISQHLKALETELDVVLLKRTTRRQSLTSAGEQFYQQCKALNQIASDAWFEVEQTKLAPQGRVRITAPNALMETLVTPAISGLLKQYPLLEPELISHDQHLDLLSEDIDLAIRVGQSEQSMLMQKRIGSFRDVLVGSKSIIENADIDTLPYVANTWQGKNIVHQFESNAHQFKQYTAKAHCVTNSFHTCLALIQSGCGIGIVPDFHLSKLSDDIALVFPEYHLPINNIYGLHPYGHKAPLNIKVSLEAITAVF
ncbi:LysR family transcriptional regulator [Shewanella goraebulensis]|uniref:LysR family transcriptional regulator n=1 Tax=Shewanella goraebulensis TaxID=3050637 RepID=UPI00254EAEA3|nr:LysR family transcriptional regulator [Shewanella goraebulensis]